MKYILASASPRRKEILSNIGLEFSVVVSDVNEESDLSSPAELCRELAERKGKAVAKLLEEAGKLDGDTVIISADTLVHCDGEILGKPSSYEDAERMLKLLSGRSHTVVSGVALTWRGKTVSDASLTEVEFDVMSDEFIKSYIDSGDCFDKAGGYAIQGVVGSQVRKINGCYFGVVGLPTNCLYRLAEENGIPFILKH